MSFACIAILNILFARIFAAAVSGSVFYLVTVFTFALQLLAFSLESGIGYFGAKGEIEDRQLVSFALLWSLLTTFIACAIVYFFFPVSFPLSYAFCFISGNMLISFGNAFCYSKFRFILPSLISIIINMALVGGLLTISLQPFAFHEKFISIYFYSFLLQGLLLFLFIAIRLKIIPFSLSIPTGALRKLFRFSLYAFIANLVYLMVSRIDYLFVKKYCTPEQLGNYIQVSKLGQLFLVFPMMIAAVLFPAIAQGGRPAMIHRIKLVSIGLASLYILSTILIALFGRSLFPFVYGNSFQNMYVPFLLLAPGILSLSILSPYTAYFAGTNRITVNIHGSLIALMFILAGDVLFIPEYGIRAAALVSSVGYFVYMVYVAVIFTRTTGKTLKSMFLLNNEEFMYLKIKWKERLRHDTSHTG